MFINIILPPSPLPLGKEGEAVKRNDCRPFRGTFPVLVRNKYNFTKVANL